MTMPYYHRSFIFNLVLDACTAPSWGPVKEFPTEGVFHQAHIWRPARAVLLWRTRPHAVCTVSLWSWHVMTVIDRNHSLQETHEHAHTSIGQLLVLITLKPLQEILTCSHCLNAEGRQLESSIEASSLMLICVAWGGERATGTSGVQRQNTWMKVHEDSDLLNPFGSLSMTCMFQVASCLAQQLSVENLNGMLGCSDKRSSRPWWSVCWRAIQIHERDQRAGLLY